LIKLSLISRLVLDHRHCLMLVEEAQPTMDARDNELRATLQRAADDAALSDGARELAQNILEWLRTSGHYGDLRSDFAQVA
jgi:hypothetical protein